MNVNSQLGFFDPWLHGVGKEMTEDHCLSPFGLLYQTPQAGGREGLSTTDTYTTVLEDGSLSLTPARSGEGRPLGPRLLVVSSCG